MNILDIVIIIVIGLCALTGLKKGFTKELVSFVGFFLVVILSFLLKNPVSIFLYEHLPFFNFGGIFKGVEVLNILVYEIISFLIVLAGFTLILKVLIFATSIFEKLLTLTIILGIPSKILGAVVGAIEGYVWSFIILFILSLPLFNLEIVKNSKFKEPVLENTPVLSSFTSDFSKAMNEFSDLKDDYVEASKTISSKKFVSEFNKNALDIFIEYKIVSLESVENLIEKNKLTFYEKEEYELKYKEA